MNKKILSYIVWLAALAVIVMLGVIWLKDRQYALVSVVMMLLACLPFALRFENKKYSTGYICLLAVMTALSAVGRFVFAPLPFFKPVTAVVIITGIYMGSDSGFVCGAASAIVSNFYFGQGPWTPFQMFAWGVIGLLAGVFAKSLKKNIPLLCIFGAFTGVAYSLIMDVWTGLWVDGALNISRYLACIITALPVTAIYAVSNVVFLLVLARPLGRKLAHALNKW